jgi:hypothetical protein
MRVSYSLSLETYKKLQQPFEAIEPVRGGLFFFLYLVTIEAGIGVAMLSGQFYSLLNHSRGPGWLPSIEVFGLGASLLAGVWVFRRLSVRRAAKDQGEFLSESYARLHCRDQRFVEATEEGLAFGCNCDKKVDNWSDVLGWAESQSDFVLWTRRNVASIPKEAFATEGERTQFRTTLLEHANGGSDLLNRSVEFCANQKDWQHAKWLLFKRGGWVHSGRLLLLAVCVTIFILMGLSLIDPDDMWSPPSVIGALGLSLAAAFLLDPLRRSLQGPKIPMKAWFAEDAIYVRAEKFALRIPWGMIVWWQADTKILIFHYRPRSVLLIPLRAVPMSQFKFILEVILARLPHTT